MYQSSFPTAQKGYPTSSNQMSDVEVQALYSSEEEFTQGIDPLLLASKLREYERLSHKTHWHIIHMFEIGTDRGVIAAHLMSHLPSNTDMHSLVRALDECGYRQLASRIFLAFLRLNMDGLSRVHKTTSGQRSGVHTFFRRLKRMVHDAQFENPRLALRNLAQRFVDQLSVETNPTKKQLIADKCIAIIGAEIDAIAITFDDKLHEHDVFSEMKKLIPDTSNTLITDVVYYGRLANANCIAGRFDDSENMLTAARSRAYHTGPCLELVNMLYIEVYVRLWQYEKNPTTELRNSLMMWGRLGLESLEHEAAETKTLWRRMFILRMVFCLLGLGNRANTIEGCQVDTYCKDEAGALLADIDKHWYGIETRREMFYCVARARLCEWKNQLPECLVYLRRAKRLAMEGHFEEIVFISDYYESLSLKTFLSTSIPDLPQNISYRNCVTSGNHSSDMSQIETRYTCKYTCVSNHTKGKKTHEPIEVSAGDSSVAIAHNAMVKDDELSAADDPYIGQEGSDNGDTTLYRRHDPNETNLKMFQVHDDLALNQLKSFTGPDSSTDKKLAISEETQSLFVNASQERSIVDACAKQTNTREIRISDVQETKADITVVKRNNGEQQAYCAKENNDTKTETKAKDEVEDLSLSFQPMSLTSINITGVLENDPFLQLNSVVLFEERGEPSGCSRESLFLQADAIEIRDDTSSVDSLDLFGD